MKSLTLPGVLIATLSSTLLTATLASAAIVVEDTTSVGNSDYDCLIEPFVVSAIGSTTQGIISRLLADRGAIVKKGQSIAQLESGMEEAAADQAQARSEMFGEVVTREADLELATLNGARLSSLFAKGLVPTQQRDESMARVKIAKAALVQAMENQKLVLRELDRARRALDQRTIKSPIDGVVVSQLAFPGELVYDNPIMSVAQLDPLRVEVVLPGSLFGTIQAGDIAQVHPEIEARNPLLARVDVVDQLLDSRSGTFGVRLRLANADLDIAAGQKCTVNFTAHKAKQIVPVGRSTPDYTAYRSSLGAALPSDDDETYELLH